MASTVLGGTLRPLHEFILLLIVDLLVEAELLDDVEVPLLLHLVVEAMLRLCVVLLLHLQEFLYGAVEGLAEQVLEALVGGLLLGVDASEEL